MSRPHTDDGEDYADLPAQMRSAPRWLLHRQKQPFYASGVPRNGVLDSPEDQAQFATFEHALRAYRRGGYDGLGFALGPDGTGNYWQGVDFDDVPNRPELQHLADDLPGYVETSPSGRGLHAVGYGRPFAKLGANGTGIEAYDGKRFFTVTGVSVSRGEPVCIAGFVEERLAPHHRAKQAANDAHHAEAGPGQFKSAFLEHDLRSALAAIPADEYGLWIRMGHALAELGELGRTLWLEWSATSEKYDHAEATAKWSTFKPDHTGFAAVFAEAQRRGWRNPGQGNAEQQAAPEEEAAPPEIFPASRLAGRPVPPREWHVPEMMPASTVTMLGGNGGVGKSMLALQLCAATALGRPWLGRTPRQGPALYLSSEDDEHELHRRLHETALLYDAGLDQLGDLHLWPMADRDAVLGTPSRNGLIEPTALWGTALQAANDLKPRLIILDSLADVFGGEENSRAHSRQFIGQLRRLAIATGAAVVPLAHPSLTGLNSGTGTSGSTGWSNSVRSRLYMSPVNDNDGPPDPDLRTLSLKKSNYARAIPDMRLRRRIGGYVLEDEGRGAFAGTAAAEGRVERLFLDLLATYTAQGRAVSPSTGANYAPALFANDPQAKGHTKSGLAAAMNRLLHQGLLRVVTDGPPSRKRYRLVLAEASQ